MRFIKPAAVLLTLAMAVTAFVPTAEARNNHYYRHGHHHGGYHGGHHRDGFGAFGAGIAGFAAGAVIGSLAAQPYYYDDAPGYYYQEPAYSYAPAPVYVSPRAYYRQERGDTGYDACDSNGVSRPATSMC